MRFPSLITFFLLVSLFTNAQQPTLVDSTFSEVEVFRQQTGKSNWMVGVNFGMGLGFLNESQTFNESIVFLDVSLNVKGGYFLADRWIAGLGYDYYATASSFGERNDYTIFSHVFAGFTRYYFWRGFFGEAQVGRGFGRDRFRNGDIEEFEHFNSMKYSVGLGIGNFWGRQINYELMLRYNQIETDYDNGQASSLQRLAIVAGVNVALKKR